MNEENSTDYVHVNTGQESFQYETNIKESVAQQQTTQASFNQPPAGFTIQTNGNVPRPVQQISVDPITPPSPIYSPFQNTTNQTGNQRSLRNSRNNKKSGKKFSVNKSSELLQKYSFMLTAAAFLAVVVISAPVIMNAYASHKYHFSTVHNIKLSSSLDTDNSSLGGLNKTVSAADLASTMQGIENQTATLNLGTQTAALLPSRIASWVTQTSIDGGKEYNLHVNAVTVASSLTDAINEFTKAPVPQVTDSCGVNTNEVGLVGQDGLSLSTTADINSQAIDIAKTLFADKGFTVNAPLVSVPFTDETPANFTKLILADVNSKRVCLFQNGQLVTTYLSSDGKPGDLTPIGEFHTWVKLTSQTMTGPGYVQPNVPWVEYFDHSGDAVHGVYWRPASVFGNANMSHGCVGLQVANAEFVYNWAPVGTTVITSPN